MAAVQGVIRTFELTATISGPMDVPFEDWPPVLQDGIYAAMERCSKKHGLPLKLVHAEYRVDHDIAPDVLGRHYVHVLLSEIVMADERNIDPANVIKPSGKGAVQ